MSRTGGERIRSSATRRSPADSPDAARRDNIDSLATRLRRKKYRQSPLPCQEHHDSGPLSSRHKAPKAAATIAEKRQWTHSRSEEHTSELQSLMRISYAVFCMKKK